MPESHAIQRGDAREKAINETDLIYASPPKEEKKTNLVISVVIVFFSS